MGAYGVRVVRAVAVVVLLASGAAVAGRGGGPVEAQAAVPTVTVSPERVGDGVFAEMALSGFPDGFSVRAQCVGEVLTAPPSEAPSLCGVVQTLSEQGQPPSLAVWRVLRRFATFDGSRSVDCVTEPSGCVAGVATLADPSDPTSTIAVAFDDLVFENALTGTPTGGLADGDTVAVQGVGMRPGEWAIAQCDRAFLADPTPDQAAALCAAPVPVEVTNETFAADLVVHDPLPTAGGGSRTCGGPGCVVVLSSPDDLATTHLGISFGPMTLTFTPEHPVASGTPVMLTTHSSVTRAVHVRLCALPLGATLPESRCGFLDGPITVADTGEGTGTTFALSDFDTPDGLLDCRVETCAYAAFDSSVLTPDEPTVAVSAPVSFLPFPTVTVEPADGLLDGETMTVTGHDLIADMTYRLVQCGNRGRLFPPFLRCNTIVGLRTGSDGTLQTTLTASQIVDNDGYCRIDCTIEVMPDAPFGDFASSTYSMAVGALTATPDRDLDDRQTVDIHGDGLMPTYDGRPLLGFPTGGWALTECDGALPDDPTLFDVFTHCSLAPLTRVVTVVGSTLDTELEVRATIDRILGGTTDCTAAPGTCVVGLVRLEVDGTVSTHLTPIAFR